MRKKGVKNGDAQSSHLLFGFIVRGNLEPQISLMCMNLEMRIPVTCNSIRSTRQGCIYLTISDKR